MHSLGLPRLNAAFRHLLREIQVYVDLNSDVKTGRADIAAARLFDAPPVQLFLTNRSCNFKLQLLEDVCNLQGVETCWTTKS